MPSDSRLFPADVFAIAKLKQNNMKHASTLIYPDIK